MACLDNYTNVHIDRGEALFLNGLRQCVLSDGVSMMTGSNSSQGVDTTIMCWFREYGTIHEAALHYVLYYLDLSMNVVSVTKLAQNTKDSKISI